MALWGYDFGSNERNSVWVVLLEIAYACKCKYFTGLVSKHDSRSNSI